MTGPAAAMRGFMAHLRLNGFTLGPGETQAALAFLAAAEPTDAATARLGLKTMLSGDRGQWERFDALFDAYWLRRGVKTAARAKPSPRGEGQRAEIWSKLLPPDAESAPQASTGDRGDDDKSGAEGPLVASRRETLARTDLRRLTSPADIDEAERLAERLAHALRYRLSRRRIAAHSGDALDLRRTIRRNLAKGGEPFDLLKKRRPEHPVNLVLLLDVSGSMRVYSRYLLAFARGLIGRWLKADAFCFHTRLIHISDALRERDRLRAMDRLSLMVEGFGGGTRIAGALQAFNDRYARETLNSRSVVIMMSDGYDTDPPEALVRELRRLKRRARRLVWLNPLLGWRDYAPVARAMAAAMPYIDCFAAANTLQSLGALEAELARL
jgi:uncharacterized protein with von Willebrand factor type A (vWA) domain